MKNCDTNNCTRPNATPKPHSEHKPRETFSVVSLFSGCGGMDLGFIGGFDFLGRHFSETGFKIVWANEISPAACKTYRANFSHHITEGDIGTCIGSAPSAADVVSLVRKEKAETKAEPSA